MDVFPSLSRLQEYAKAGCYDVAPVSVELYADVATPIETLKAFKERGEACFLFESVEGGEKWARYSFIGFSPVEEIFVKDGVVTITEGASVRTVNTSDPNAEIRKILSKYKSPQINGLPTFTGGFVGYFAYEYYKYAEKIDLPAGVFGDARLFLFNKVVAYDNVKHKIVVLTNVSLYGDLEENYRVAIEELQGIKQVI
ncbi:MAG: anthranilate synthase component I, partial [Clostridia bacterium]|nr:anthranilate synthase component I [Clostridia bacterium]